MPERNGSSGGLLDEVIEAHGGRDRWRAVGRIEAAVSSGGLAFAMRLQPFALRGLRLTLEPHAPRVALRDFGRAGWCGVWTPDRVELRDENNSLVAGRDAPRGQFRRWGRLVRWDRLDVLYFAGYALWNYLSFPFLLELPGVRVTEPDDPKSRGPRRLLATFPLTVATHSAQQTFHVDGSGHLIRHDYTAELFSRWATAANYCLASAHVGGLRFYARRKVYPRLGGRIVLPFPTLVWIEVGDIAVTAGEQRMPGSEVGR